jgi:hypothetical protein
VPLEQLVTQGLKVLQVLIQLCLAQRVLKEFKAQKVLKDQ